MSLTLRLTRLLTGPIFAEQSVLICLVNNSEKLGVNGVIIKIDECNFACDKLSGKKETNLINLTKANQN